MSTVVNGITCEELVEDFEEGIDDRGPYAVKKWLCNWSDRYALANSFLGFVSHTGGQSGSIQIHSPLAYPESLNMLARTVQIQGRGQATQGTQQIQWAKAVVTVNYGVPTWQAIPYPDMSIDPTQPFVYATQDIDFGREFLAIPGSALQLANGNTMDDTPYSLPIPYAVFTITLHQVPFLPAQAIFTSMKKPLNITTFLGIPAGYLRFDGAKNHAEASSDGTYLQSLTLVFSARTLLRWDETYDKNGTGGPQQIRYNGTAVLQRSEFRALIPSNYGT